MTDFINYFISHLLEELKYLREELKTKNYFINIFLPLKSMNHVDQTYCISPPRLPTTLILSKTLKVFRIKSTQKKLVLAHPFFKPLKMTYLLLTLGRSLQRNQSLNTYHKETRYKNFLNATTSTIMVSKILQIKMSAILLLTLYTFMHTHLYRFKNLSITELNYNILSWIINAKIY